MATLVCFHAHPDDECIQTAGVMAKAAAEGHRVVLVVATRGEHGEFPDDILDPGEALRDLRVREVTASAALLGVSRLEFLGYVDSGMIGTPENEAPECFWRADVEEAAHRLAAILDDEQADVLTVYDDHGGYGHPDHIQVHRVGRRAGELAGTRRVFEATMNRDLVLDGIATMREEAIAAGTPADDVELPTLPDDFGTPVAQITAAI
ncbi:MAG: PIG-L family deacetylase, partial [Acidimicrobiales bacterium]